MGIDNAAQMWNCWKAGRNDSLLELLHLVPSFETTEPVDRVYAILGLLRHVESANGASGSYGRSQLRLQPDYKKPVVGVYSDAVRETILLEPSGLRFFLLVEQCQALTTDESETVQWPSWVPQLLGAKSRGLRWTARTTQTKASGDTSPLIQHGTSYREIGFGGLLVSTIASVKSVPKPPLELEDEMQYARDLHELLVSATTVASDHTPTTLIQSSLGH